MSEPKKDKNFRVTNNNAVDVHVGRRIRLRRTLLGMSQEQLGSALNITFQQVQKYERGANRVSASRLWDISQIIDVPISYFFEEMSDVTLKASPRKMASNSSNDITVDDAKDPMARRETLELVRTYYSIEEAHVRRRIADMVKAIAQTIKGE
ncbi:MAG: helix-turn-helix domain-containing protein [Candidatus Puniceispirillaceae bacterium]